MTQPALDRLTFLAFGLAGGLSALGDFDVHAAVPDGPTVLKPFAHSRTVTTFAQGLFDHWHFADETNFPPLRQMIDAEFIRTGTPNIHYWNYHPAIGPAPKDSEADKIERRRAAFFARLAVEYIAPRALRRAGFEQMAADVAGGMLSPAGAQHAIGRKYAHCETPMLANCAYGASAHASTAAFYAAHRDIDVVTQTGYFCARALLDASFYDDVAVENPDEVWNFAAAAMNTAIELHDAEAGAVLG